MLSAVLWVVQDDRRCRCGVVMRRDQPRPCLLALTRGYDVVVTAVEVSRLRRGCNAFYLILLVLFALMKKQSSGTPVRLKWSKTGKRPRFGRKRAKATIRPGGYRATTTLATTAPALMSTFCLSALTLKLTYVWD